MQARPILRYKGSKHRNGARIFAYAPEKFDIYAEAFLGGGSLLFRCPTNVRRIANDLNSDLIRFHSTLRGDPEYNRYSDIIDDIMGMRNLVMPEERNGPLIRRMFADAKRAFVLENDSLAFFFLNRYSHQHIVARNRPNIASFEPAYSHSSMQPITREKLEAARAALQGVELHNLHFSEFLKYVDQLDGTVLCVLDPPYWLGTTGLYDHEMTWQEHIVLAEWMKTTRHHVLMTNADNAATARLYFGRDFQTPLRKEPGFFLAPLEYRYSTLIKGQKRQRKREWIITNYNPPAAVLAKTDWSKATMNTVLAGDIHFSELACCEKELFEMCLHSKVRCMCRICGREVRA